MSNRLILRYVLFATCGWLLLACGDDKGSNTGSVGQAGTAGKLTTGGSGGASGRSSARGTAGRGNPGGQTCPMTEADAAGSCTPARGTCMYDGGRVCDCISETMAWACWSPSDCPTTTPAERSSCSVVGMTCSPMRGVNCSCTAQGWNCGNQYCPPAEPVLASACEEGAGVCSYGARTCDCDSAIWACWAPASDCPNPPPKDRAACPLKGVVCDYAGGSCECNGMSGWRCGRGVMNDDDAGVPPMRPARGSAGAGGGAAGQAGGAGMPRAGASAGASGS